MKPSDYSGIPLCDGHHKECHRSREKFEKRYGICLFEIAFNLLHLYHYGVPATMHLELR